VTSLLSVALRRRYAYGGQRTRRSLLPHAGRAGAVVPHGLLGHVLMEDTVYASWRGGTAGWAHRHAVVWAVGVAPCTSGSRPATRSCALPAGRFPAPPCPLLLTHSGPSSSILVVIIACDGVGWRPLSGGTAPRTPL